MVRKMLHCKLYVFLWFAILLTIFVNVSTTQLTYDHKEKTTLEQVAIVHRHGIRTPLRTWPNDPYGNQEKFWSIGWGQLLPKGKQQLYKLGTTFRNYYNDFISEYEPDSVRVNSSDIDRCQMSVAALLAGWFPPIGEQIWSKKLLWQPIPIHSVPNSEDRVIDLKAPCDRYKSAVKSVHKDLKKHESSDVKKLKKYLTKHMGEKIHSINQIETYYATLVIEERTGHKLPKWTKKVYPDKMKQLAMLNFKTYSWNDYLKRITGGPLIKDIVNNFKRKTEGDDKSSKINLYSAHDSTIAHLWYALEFQKLIWPDFGSALIFELHKEHNQHIVKLKYIDDYSKTKPRKLSIPNCPSPCTFARFQKITEKIRAVDWNKDCKLN